MEELLPEPRSTSELARPLAVAGSLLATPPPPDAVVAVGGSIDGDDIVVLLAEALMEEPASMVESRAPNARISPCPEALALMKRRSLPLPKSMELFSEP